MNSCAWVCIHVVGCCAGVGCYVVLAAWPSGDARAAILPVAIAYLCNGNLLIERWRQHRRSSAHRFLVAAGRLRRYCIDFVAARCRWRVVDQQHPHLRCRSDAHFLQRAGVSQRFIFTAVLGSGAGLHCRVLSRILVMSFDPVLRRHPHARERSAR